MTVQLPATHSAYASVRAYAVGLVMNTVAAQQHGLLAPAVVVKNADVIAQYILNGLKEDA